MEQAIVGFPLQSWRSLANELPKYLGDSKQQKLFGFFTWEVRQKEEKYYATFVRQKLKCTEFFMNLQV